MKANRRNLHIVALAIFTITLILPATACQQGGGDLGMTLVQAYNNAREYFIMQGANDRIEKTRKGDVNVTVVDDKGNAVRDARVYYEQQSHDFLFGSNLSPLSIKEGGPNAVNQKWADAYVALFNYGTLPFYWDSYEPAQGETAEQILRAMADWARKRGIATKGHPLVWADVTPAWAPPSVNDMQNAQERRVKNIAGNFCGLVEYWDVVNEPTNGPRANSPIGNWMNTKTPAVVCTDAINWARSACPKSTLIINDYRTDQDFRDILQNIIRQKGKFDAIGLQSHMHRGNWPLYQVWDTCERFKDFDVPLHFTEVTVLSGTPKSGISTAQPAKQGDWPTTAAGEAAQAEYVEKFYTLLFSHPSVTAITWWDFSDNGAWQGAPAGLLRADMSKKPAYDKLLKMVKSTWWSFGDAYTNMEGKASIRGYYGSYKLVIEKEGKRADATLYLAKGIDNKIKIQLKGYIQKPPTPLYEQIWPYAVALIVIVLAILIIRWVIKLQRRI
jgi:endo-1,4-beta-xylanase